MFARNLAVAAFAVVVLAGCNNQPSTPPTAPTGRVQGFTEPVVAAEAGVDLNAATVSANIPGVQAFAQSMFVRSRPDPFALLGQEVSFDREQLAERVVSDFGGFASEYELPDEETAPPPTLQPRPVWRLSGVVITQGGIVGLLDMGMPTANGSAMEIRPGQQIPGTPFTVVSLDSEKAVLRRNDNQLPREITIFLEGPLPGMGAPAGGGAPGAGAPPGRPPGAGRPPEDER